MPCDQAREQLSAWLDGESGARGQVDDGSGREAAQAHLDGCAACARWREQARLVTRMARTAAVSPARGLSAQALDKVLAAAPAQPRASASARVAKLLRVALLAVGLAQFLLGVAQIADLAGIADAHTHSGGVPVSSGHLWHESAAWNVAVGAALAWLAWRRSRPASLLPVMTAFVAVLGLLTVNDALTGRVDTDRILSHSLLLAGYALLLALHHPRLWGRRPPAGRAGGGSRRTIGRGAEDDEGPPATVHPFPARAHVPGKAAGTAWEAAA